MPRIFRPTALALPLALTLAAPAGAQGLLQASFLDYFSPDRVAARLLQLGVLSLRTQAEISYGTLSTSVLAGTATVTDLRIRPHLPGLEDCEITADRLQLNTVPMGDLDHMRLQLRLNGASAAPACLPPEAGPVAMLLGGQPLHLPQVTLDLDYALPSSAARLHGQVVADGLLALGLDLAFDYAWVETDRWGDPLPALVLDSGRVTVENLGLWQALQPMLPPEFTDPEQFGAMLDGLLAQMPGPRDAPAAPPSATGDDAAPQDEAAPVLSPARAALSASVKAAWAQFLANPQRLVLETGLDGPRRLDFDRWEQGGPDAMLQDLNLRLQTAPTAAAAMLASALLSRAYDAPDQLSDAERLTVGRALASGEGAPRDLDAARRLLGAAAEAGSSAAAAALAQALAGRDDAAAYDMALVAAQAGEPGSAGLLDRIEAALPLARVLALQDARQDSVERAIDSLQSLASIRSEARMHLSGKGRLRSYREAALWAMLGTAAGDSESAAILQDLDAMAGLSDAEGRQAWAEREQQASELAHAAWTGFDLPKALAGQ